MCLNYLTSHPYSAGNNQRNFPVKTSVSKFKSFGLTIMRIESQFEISINDFRSLTCLKYHSFHSYGIIESSNQRAIESSNHQTIERPAS